MFEIPRRSSKLLAFILLQASALLSHLLNTPSQLSHLQDAWLLSSVYLIIVDGMPLRSRATLTHWSLYPDWREMSFLSIKFTHF